MKKDITLEARHPLLSTITFRVFDNPAVEGCKMGEIILSTTLHENSQYVSAATYGEVIKPVDEMHSHLLASVMNSKTTDLRRRVEIPNQDSMPIFHNGVSCTGLKDGLNYVLRIDGFTGRTLWIAAAKIVRECRAIGVAEDWHCDNWHRGILEEGGITGDLSDLTDFDPKTLKLVSLTGEPGPVFDLHWDTCEEELTWEPILRPYREKVMGPRTVMAEAATPGAH